MSAHKKPFQVIAVPAFTDNYLWLIVHQNRAVVVDPGQAAPIEQALAQHDAQLEAILVTHHHGDHIGGLAALSRKYGVPVHGPANEGIVGVNAPQKEGSHLQHLGLRFEVMEVPGHTHGHLAYYTPEARWLFCGDTLFAAGCGRVFEGTHEQMFQSLSRLAALPDNTEVYCAHEYTLTNLRFARSVEPDNPALIEREAQAQALRAQGRPTVPSTLALERATNPFLRCNEPDLQQTVLAHARSAEKAPTTDALATFIALRQWKDAFQ